MVLWAILAVLFVVQLFAPYLAAKIKRRYEALGYTMASKTNSAMLNISSFWREASEKNRVLGDEVVAKYLSIYRAWWGAVIVTFIPLLVN